VLPDITVDIPAASHYDALLTSAYADELEEVSA
jgi:hypothetical protein